MVARATGGLPVETCKPAHKIDSAAVDAMDTEGQDLPDGAVLRVPAVCNKHLKLARELISSAVRQLQEPEGGC